MFVMLFLVTLRMDLTLYPQDWLCYDEVRISCREPIPALTVFLYSRHIAPLCLSLPVIIAPLTLPSKLGLHYGKRQ